MQSGLMRSLIASGIAFVPAVYSSAVIAAVTASPTSVAFGNQGVGLASPPQTVTLTNVGASVAVISGLSTTGDFSITNSTCPSSLAPSQSCLVSLRFLPAQAGLRIGSLAAVTSFGTTTAALSGTGTIGTTSQSITFPAIPDRTLGLGPFTPSATASSGLPVVITSQAVAICTVGGNTVTTVATGTCTLAANQSGNGVFAPAPQVVRSFAVTNANGNGNQQVPLPGWALLMLAAGLLWIACRRRQGSAAKG